jgi:hypothetical protein
MPLESLNAQRVETARAPIGGRLEIRDKKVAGLEL